MTRATAKPATRPVDVRPRSGRAKLSTTVSADTFAYLEGKVAAGHAASIAEAVDASIRLARRIENRERLSRATAEYFQTPDSRAAREEDVLTEHLASALEGVDFDEEF